MTTPPPPHSHPTPQEAPKTSGLAIASLVCGCLLFVPFIGVVTSLAAIVLGIIALVTISNSEGRQKGQGLAIAGLVLGCLPLLILPAMAIPAFQKVRATSQEKAITNNLRMFASAGQQYMLDHSVPAVDYADLVGPAKHISQLEPVAGESYEDLTVTVMTTVLTVETEDGREISYTF